MLSILCSLSMIAVLPCFTPPAVPKSAGGVNRTTFEQITPEMSQADVEALVGCKPSSIDYFALFFAPTYSCNWLDNKKQLSVDYKIISGRSHFVAKWYEDESEPGTIAFEFELRIVVGPIQPEKTDKIVHSMTNQPGGVDKATLALQNTPKPLKVGEIIIMGNEKTENSVILSVIWKSVELYPGQDFTPSMLQHAEASLCRSGFFKVNRRERPVVTVIERDGDVYGPFRDIQVQVHEKDDCHGRGGQKSVSVLF
jgi:hypothetical protein